MKKLILSTIFICWVASWFLGAINGRDDAQAVIDNRRAQATSVQTDSESKVAIVGQPTLNYLRKGSWATSMTVSYRNDGLLPIESANIRCIIKTSTGEITKVKNGREWSEPTFAENRIWTESNRFSVDPGETVTETITLKTTAGTDAIVGAPYDCRIFASVDDQVALKYVAAQQKR